MKPPAWRWVRASVFINPFHCYSHHGKENLSSINKGNTITNRLTTILFTVYLMALAWILLFKLGVKFSYMERRTVNLIPFNEALIAYLLR